MTQKEKKAYLTDMCLKHRLLNNGEQVSLIVDGLQYTLRNGRLVITDIVELPKDGSLVIDNAFDEIDFMTGHGEYDNTRLEFDKLRTNLRVLHLGSIGKISEEAFKDCVNLVTVTGNKLKSVPGEAFKGCRSLKTVNMSNLRVVQGLAFSQCRSLKTLTSKRISMLGQEAFSGTPLEKLECGKLSLSYLSLDEMNNLKYLKADSIQYICENLIYTPLQYLDLGEFMHDDYYINTMVDNNSAYVYYKKFGVTDKQKVIEFVKEDTWLAKKVGILENEKEVYINDFLTSLPYKTCKEIHYKLSTLYSEVQKYYDKRFKLLMNLGIKVVRDL